MSPQQDDETLSQLTLFAEGSPVKTSVLLDAVREFLESDQGFGLSSFELLRSLNQAGLLSKTSLACFPATQETSRQVTYSLDSDGQPQKKATWPSSFEGWGNAGIGGPTGFVTLSISEWPKDAAVCSLSQVLEADVPKKYFLSAKAAHGILRRAEKRGRDLPPTLRAALEAVAQSPSTGPQTEAKTKAGEASPEAGS